MICAMCPRQCHALRNSDTGHGHCRMPSVPVVARAALHHWEEPPISGTTGSGTIFFSGCSLDCIFCQNEKISHQDYGKQISVERLHEICLALVAQGAHNINFVNPTHYAHVILELLQTPLPVPVVWNSGGFDSVETLQALFGSVQIYLPDLKYVDASTSLRYSNAHTYPSVAMAAIQEMVHQTGPYQLDGNGLLTQGVIIRHLILPGQVSQAKRVMDWVADTFPPHTVLFSLMSQYTPWNNLDTTPELNRRLRHGEINSAISYMQNLGLDGFYQERTSAKEEYTPPFDLTGV